jgi:hypothetical protein
MKHLALRVTVVIVGTLALFGCARGITNAGYDGADGGVAFTPAFSGPASVACTNLQCRQQACSGSAKTTVSGTVFDPAGKNPLYNVIVYVPNAPLEPQKEGATCARCGSVLSGQPIVTALTDTHGHFVLENVPAGKDVPVVVQIGKWRRQISLPVVYACEDNTFIDPETFRLPRSRAEGEMPHIALSTGCDPMECLLRKVGIDDAEFTAGDGDGHVHLYRGAGGGGSIGSSSAYDFWTDEAKLSKYDVVINACECKPYARGATAYAAMSGFLDKGGRFFGSHYHYNWFTDVPSETDDAVDWTPGGQCNIGPNFVDDTFPKGKALAEWLMVTGASQTYGQLPLSCAPLDVGRTKNKLATGWIYDGPTQAPSYVSFNTPIDAADPADQCGRAVFADLHVMQEDHGDVAGLLFPNGCHTTDLSPQEKALEFMFFDLSSCVLDDSAAPTVPQAVR